MARRRNDANEALDAFNSASDHVSQRADEGDEPIIRFDAAGSAGGLSDWNRLEFQDGKRHYVWVPKSGLGRLSPRGYEACGYRREHHEEGGVRMFFSQEKVKLGEIIEDGFENILMSCSKKQKQSNDHADPMTGAGQERINALERRITRTGSPEEADPMRGESTRHFQYRRPERPPETVEELRVNPSAEEEI